MRKYLHYLPMLKAGQPVPNLLLGAVHYLLLAGKNIIKRIIVA